MNQAPSNQTGVNNTFSSTPGATGPQTNPFTADLKGEFTSNFGTNTNAVSQIFKEGGFVGQNRTKWIIIGGAVIVVIAVAIFVMWGPGMGGGSDDATPSTGTTQEIGNGDKTAATDDKSDDQSDDASDDADTSATAAKPADKTATQAKAAPVAQPADAATPNTAAAQAPAASGPIALNAPANGSSMQYDETSGPAEFSWSGAPGGSIVFSRNQNMKPETLRVPVNGNSYSFHHPWPGTWYWHVENASGASETRSFTVAPPARRNVQLSAPAAGASIQGNGGQVTWQGDSKVAFYRVELSTGNNWANPSYRFATSGTQVQLQGVTAGSYQMRLGAFSEVSGRWEYTDPVSVTVQ